MNRGLSLTFAASVLMLSQLIWGQQPAAVSSKADATSGFSSKRPARQLLQIRANRPS